MDTGPSKTGVSTTALRIWLIAMTVVVALIAAACSSSSDAADQPTEFVGGITDTETESTPTTTFDIRAAQDLGDPIAFHQAQEGECLNEYDWVQDRQPRNLLIALDCDIPHDKEVYAIDTFEAGPDDPYPGEELMKDIATRKCYNAFADFVGLTYEDSVYDIDLTFPPRENYEVGYRDIICMVVTSEQTVGSAAGSGL